MKICIAFYCAILSIQVYAQTCLSELRLSLDKVQINQEYAFTLYDKLQKESLTGIEIGYYGVVESILATHTYDPVKKISYFNAGKNKLEKAIQHLPHNTELRYLRLMMQLNAPTILGYTSNIEMDRNYIIATIEVQKNELGTMQYQRMLDNLILKGKCSESQIIQLQKLKSE